MLWERLLRRLSYRWLLGAVVVLLLAVNVGWAANHSPAVTVPLSVAATLSLLALPRFPVAVLGIQIGYMVIADIGFGSANPFGLWVALCAVAAVRPRRVSLWGAFAALLGVLASREVTSAGATVAGVLSVGVAWVLGDTIRARRTWQRQEREESRRLAAAEEQARIARELHDVVAHSVSVMVVQAAAANDVFESRPDEARKALGSIEETGRAALAELRRLLGVVRTPAADALAPQPGLAALDELVARVRTAGLQVELSVDGELSGLPAGLDLSAYRIVQEALTNTLKHAAASHAEVGVRRTSERLELEITDDGVGNANGEVRGRGLVGMHERASLLGGEVVAGPLPGHGFRVLARLPL